MKTSNEKKLSLQPQTQAFLKSLPLHLGQEDKSAPVSNMNLLVVRNTERAPLKDGTKAKLGMIYHAGIKEAWETVDVHFVYLKRALLYTEWDEEKKDYKREETSERKMQLFVGGFLADAVDTPFIYKVRGMNWTKFIEYQQVLDTLIRDFSVPMLAFKTTLTTTEEKNGRGGKAWVIKPSIVKTSTGQPVLQEDIEKLRKYSESIPFFTDIIQDTIKFNVGQTVSVTPEIFDAPPSNGSLPAETTDVKDVHDDIEF